MLSSSFDISEFMKKVEGHSNQEIIYMADLEATAAERFIRDNPQPRMCKDGHRQIWIIKKQVENDLFDLGGGYGSCLFFYSPVRFRL